MSTTLAQYRTAVSSKLGLDNSTAGDQTLIDSWVNEGVTDVVLRSGCRVRSATLTLTSGTADYTLDTSIMRIKVAYVTSTGASFPLEAVAIDELLLMREASTASVSPAQYYAVAGSDLFMIYPTPASSSDTVTVYYIPRPTTLSASSDTPSEIPSEFQKAVEFYALREGADFSDDASSQTGQAYMQMYELWLRRIKKWVETKGGHRMPLATVRSPISRLPFHDRSRYP